MKQLEAEADRLLDEEIHPPLFLSETARRMVRPVIVQLLERAGWK